MKPENKALGLKPFYGDLFYKDKIFDIDNGHNIFFKINKSLLIKGVAIHTIDTLDTAALKTIVYCDLPYFWEIKLWWIVIRNAKKNVLLCFESPLVNPFSTMPVFYFLFRKVYTWKDSHVDNKKVHKFYIPLVDHKFKRRTLQFDKRKLLVLINANKKTPLIFEILANTTNLYKERLKAIAYFERHLSTQFDLYGRWWSPELAVYKGTVKNKIECLSKYKFNICFENCTADGYITEKIFDCFKAGCVPVYYGASNISKYIPQNTYIDMRKFKNYYDLVSFLERMSEEEHKKYTQNAQSFMNKMGKWSKKEFENLLVTIAQ